MAGEQGGTQRLEICLTGSRTSGQGTLPSPVAPKPCGGAFSPEAHTPFRKPVWLALGEDAVVCAAVPHCSVFCKVHGDKFTGWIHMPELFAHCSSLCPELQITSHRQPSPGDLMTSKKAIRATRRGAGCNVRIPPHLRHSSRDRDNTGTFQECCKLSVMLGS